MSTIIIIGASAAGLAACGKLRQFNSTARIICITKEDEMPYNRCLIADFLSGSRTEAQVHTKDAQFFVDNNIELILGCEVISLDIETKMVRYNSSPSIYFATRNIQDKPARPEPVEGSPRTDINNGETLPYDALLIATGRSAFVPPPLDVNMPGVFPFYDLDHAKDILNFIGERTNVQALVVGGGISGLECADALVQRGVNVTLVEREPHLLPRQIDVGGARFLQRLVESKGIKVHCDTTITGVKSDIHEDRSATLRQGQGERLEQEFSVDQNLSTNSTEMHQSTPAHGEPVEPYERMIAEGSQRRLQAILSNGTTINVDMIIAATGGRQNLQFAQTAGITCDTFGIVTDELQATNIDDVFAAGDVCSVNSLLTNQQTCSTLWPDAVAQGMTAAHSIALYLLQYGNQTRLPSKPYAGTLNITSTNIFGTTLVTCGDFSALDASSSATTPQTPARPELVEGPQSSEQLLKDLRTDIKESQSGIQNSGFETVTKQDETFYHKLFLCDGILQGFVMVGNVTSVGQFRKAMVEKTRIV